MQEKSDLAQALSLAYQERDMHYAKMKELESSIKELEGFIGYAEKFLRQEHVSGEDKIKNRPVRQWKGSLTKLAIDVLQANGAPMRIEDILKEIAKAGYGGGKEIKYTSLYSALARRKPFCKWKKPGVFGLKIWKEKEKAPSEG